MEIRFKGRKLYRFSAVQIGQFCKREKSFQMDEIREQNFKKLEWRHTNEVSWKFMNWGINTNYNDNAGHAMVS